MRRRHFIAAAGCFSASGPFASLAQQARSARIGLLSSASLEKNAHLLNAFRRGLDEVGYREGNNVTIDYRSADGHYEQLPALANELVRSGVDILVAFENTATVMALARATTVIPIVFSIGGDPVKLGLVQSLARPGGNTTGITALTVGLGQKRLEVLREVVPPGAKVALLVNQSNPNAVNETNDILAAAKELDVTIELMT